MKKILFFLLLVPFGIAQAQTDWTVGMTPAQARTAINNNFDALMDSLATHYLANLLNYNGILSLNDSVAAHLARLDAAADSLAAHNSRFETITGGTGDLAFTDTVSGTGFLQTQFRSDTAIANLREEIEAIEVGEAQMVYPGAGIALSTGSAWSTSITNNSTNWNTAYGWGDHGVEGYTTAADVGDIISDSLAAIAAAADTALILGDSTTLYHSYNDGVNGLLLKLNKADSSGVASGSYVSGNDFTQGQLLKLNKADSTGMASGNYISRYQLNAAADVKKDTVSFFVFGAGLGLTADTAGIQTTTNYGGWFHDGRDTLVITKLITTIGDGPGFDTLNYQIWVNDTITTTYAAKMFTNPDSIGRRANVNPALTVGFSRTTFSTTPFKIPPRVHIWMTSPAVVAGRKPTYVRTTMIGYKINGIY